jgi:3-methyladenine DNA glycosylase AlkC
MILIIGFIEYVIRPSFNAFGDVMEFITRKRITHDNINTMSIERTWDEHLNDNVAKWNQKC